MRILFLGSPEYAALPLRALAESGHEIVGVVTQPDRPSGRSRAPAPPPVALAARELGLPLFQPPTLRDPAVVEQLAALRPDAAVLAAYGEILRKKVLAIPPRGVLNIHPSLLPRWRGPSPVAGAILAGDRETGVSIMLLDAGMDSGPLLAQRRVPLDGDERAGPLTTRLFELGAELLLEALPAYASGAIEPRPQEGEAATYTRLLAKDDGLVRWEEPAAQIERAVRAYDPWPGSFSHWRGARLRLLSAAVASPAAPAPPGTLAMVGARALVACGEGALELLEVQPAGKQPMRAADWARGQKPQPGEGFGVGDE
jgi:methionyl-tRNA formyltransferase